jgi:DNA-binding transcriptional ArsR family regulator
MVRHMANNLALLDSAFHALADPTRRAVISRLRSGPASVGELARPFAIGLPTFMKHLRVLEDSGLIASGKTGRVRTCRLEPARLADAEAWLAEQRAVWEGRAERLSHYVENHLHGSSGDDER